VGLCPHGKLGLNGIKTIFWLQTAINALLSLLALEYGLRKKAKKMEKKRRCANYTEDTLTEIGSKWSKKKKRRR
jgi:hypothetical protein